MQELTSYIFAQSTFETDICRNIRFGLVIHDAMVIEKVFEKNVLSFQFMRKCIESFLFISV